jgi:ribosome-associated protein
LPGLRFCRPSATRAKRTTRNRFDFQPGIRRLPLDELELAHSIVDAIEDKQGEDIVLLDLRKLSPYVDYFIVCTGSSERQLRAIADSIEEHTFKAHDAKPRRREGVPESGWILLDYRDVVIHIFSTSQRKYYQLEQLWKEASIVLKIQ